MQFTYIPYCKISPEYFTVYSQPDEDGQARLRAKRDLYSHFNSLKNLELNQSEGDMSFKSSKALKLAVSWLEHTSKWQKVFCPELDRDVRFKINFITLTLPVNQVTGFCDNYGNLIEIDNAAPFVHRVNSGDGVFDFRYSDEFVKKNLLNHFFVVLKRKFGVHNYIWRAEAQKNGNIHFHITLNRFIWLKDLRDCWNNILSKTDMIELYTKKFSSMSWKDYYEYRKGSGNPNYNDIKRAYEFGLKTEWKSPNTTDIHAVWKIKNIGAYLCSYLTKNNENYRKINGFLWRSSYLLARLKSAVEVIGGKLGDEIQHLMKNFKNRIIEKPFCSVFCFKISDLKHMFKNSEIVRYFTRYRDSVYKNYINLLANA